MFDSYVNDAEAGPMVGVRQFDEREVLERALTLFRRRGFTAAAMQELAEATGVQRGSLYNAFGGKEELFLRAYELYAAGFLQATRRALADPDPANGLMAMFDAAVSNMTMGTPSPGCLTTRTITDADQVGEKVRDRMRRLLEELTSLLTDALSRPEASARLALPAREAANLVVTFTRGLAVMERLDEEPEAMLRQAEALVRLIVPR